MVSLSLLVLVEAIWLSPFVKHALKISGFSYVCVVVYLELDVPLPFERIDFRYRMCLNV